MTGVERRETPTETDRIKMSHWLNLVTQDDATKKRVYTNQSMYVFVLVCVCSDEREAVQKKTFTKWVNSHLSRVSCRITDLYMDLRDGRMLIKLLEVLSGERLVSETHNIHTTYTHTLINIGCDTSQAEPHLFLAPELT